MGTKDTRTTQINIVAVIKRGVMTGVTKDYAYCPRTHFGGGTVKWFDDGKLVKGGARV